MNKSDLIETLSRQLNVNKSEVSQFINAYHTLIIEKVNSGEEVQIAGFGKFGKRVRSQRTGRNPQTGECIVIPETIVPYFKAGSVFKNQVKSGGNKND